MPARGHWVSVSAPVDRAEEIHSDQAGICGDRDVTKPDADSVSSPRTRARKVFNRLMSDFRENNDQTDLVYVCGGSPSPSALNMDEVLSRVSDCLTLNPKNAVCDAIEEISDEIILEMIMKHLSAEKEGNLADEHPLVSHPPASQPPVSQPPVSGDIEEPEGVRTLIELLESPQKIVGESI
eukprot:216484_1